MRRFFPKFDPQDFLDGIKAFARILLLGFSAGFAAGMFLTGCKLALKIVP